MTKKAALYARVSTKKQDLKPQIEILEKYCKEKNFDYKIFSDFAKSGATTFSRPSFKKLMKNLEEFDVVIVTKLDRFGRSVLDLVNNIKMLEAKGVKFISIGDSIDTSSPQGRLHFHIMCAFAEFERSIINERMREGRKRAEKYGSKSGKPCHRPKKDLNLEKEKIKELVEKGVSESFLAKLCGVSRGTMHSRLVEWGWK